MRALHPFFLATQANGQPSPIPPVVTADLWHLFAASTREYEIVCRSAFGHPLPPTAATGLRGSVIDDEALERTWTHTCRQEGIQPHRPSRLPLLFEVDARLGIADGFTWVLDRSDAAIEAQRKRSRNMFCADDLARMVPRGGADNGGETVAGA